MKAHATNCAGKADQAESRIVAFPSPEGGSVEIDMTPEQPPAETWSEGGWERWLALSNAMAWLAMTEADALARAESLRTAR